MDTETLTALIDEYNRVEHDQERRLTDIYRAMRDRSGSGRFVRFGQSRNWTGAIFHPMDERFSLPSHIEPMIECITEYYLGEDPRES